MNWRYPSKGEFPSFRETVYIWDEGKLWRGCYVQRFLEGKNYKWWNVYGKGGLTSMQNYIEAWLPLSEIESPEQCLPF